MNISEVVEPLLAKISTTSDAQSLEKIRLDLFGKTGLMTVALHNLKILDPAAKKEQGSLLNKAKEALLSAMQKQAVQILDKSLQAQLAQEWLDVSLAPRLQEEGRLHPIYQVMEEIVSFFHRLGFTSVDGPHIEDDYHNFTALNILPLHPARQLMDTFYFPCKKDGKDLLLRTHTSNVQIRALAQIKPPLRLVSAGRVFRSDYDITHTPNFHQIECIVIEPNITMAHLKGCLKDFLAHFFQVNDLPLRFRPSFFPFTEPSAEVDIGCSRKEGKVTLGGDEDWLEILGCGMIHPHVLQNCGIDPSSYQGFAIGVGVERLAMLKYGMTDLRAFYENDIRWLKHYGFSLVDDSAFTPKAQFLSQGLL